MSVAAAGLPGNVPADRVVDFDLFEPVGLEEGFHGAWLRLHRAHDAGLLWTARNGGHWIVNDGELVHRLYADHQHLSSRITQLPRDRSAGNDAIPATVDPPELKPYRRVINATLAPPVVAAMAPEITGFAAQLAADLAPRGGCEFVTDFALRLPLELFMGYAELPLEDIPRLRFLVEEKMRPSGALSAGEVQAELGAYLMPILRERRAEPGEDLLSQIIIGQVAGREMTDDEARRICTQFLVAGLDTVAATLSFIFLELARNPQLRRRLAGNDEAIAAATPEFFRRFPLVSRVRELNDDLECDGVLLRRGDLILIPTVLHGLSEAHFDDPETVDIDRPGRPNSTFGHGPHRCPGAFLARAEVEAALREWLCRIREFEVADEGAVEFRAGFVASVAALPLRWDPA